MKKRVTLRDIGRAVGVSHVTVSKALGNNPKISEAKRKEIKEVAKRMGYRPDPILSALVVYRQANRPLDGRGTLAWINSWKPAERLQQCFAGYYRGAADRCGELGYQMEEFRLAELGPNERAERRLSSILRARNIQGVLLPPQQRNRAHLNLAWQNFSTVAFGFSLVRPRFHVVTNAQFRSGMIAMRALRARGYRRIGYVVMRAFEQRTDHNFTGAFMVEQLRMKEKDRIPALFLPNPSSRPWEDWGVMEHIPASFPATPALAEAKSALKKWFQLHQPEVILASGTDVPLLMRGIGYIEGKDYRLALCNAFPGSQMAGVCQNEILVGKAAVDTLVSLINRNERGVPSTPLYTFVEGYWLDGPRLPRRNVRAE